MTDPTNDIDALLSMLWRDGRDKYHAALTALVAERDALRKECNNRFVKIKELVAEEESLRAELAAAIKQRDEARREVCELRYTPSEDNNNIWYAGTRGWDCYAQQEGGGA